MKNIIRQIMIICCLYTSAMYSQSNNVIDSLKISVQKLTKVQKIDHFITLAGVYEKVQNRNLDSARYYAEQALALSKQYKKPIKSIDALYVLGLIKIDMQHYEEGKLHMEEVLAKSKVLSYEIGERKGNVGMGEFFAANGEVKK